LLIMLGSIVTKSPLRLTLTAPVSAKDPLNVTTFFPHLLRFVSGKALSS